MYEARQNRASSIHTLHNKEEKFRQHLHFLDNRTISQRMYNGSIWVTNSNFDNLFEDDLDEEEKSDDFKKDPNYTASFRELYGGFTQATLNAMFPNYTPNTKYQCVKCGKYFPRKRDRKDSEAYITIDHKISVKEHWFKKGRNTQSGEELNKWYNDTSNLQLMCSTHNSQKGG